MKGAPRSVLRAPRLSGKKLVERFSAEGLNVIETRAAVARLTVGRGRQLPHTPASDLSGHQEIQLGFISVRDHFEPQWLKENLELRSWYEHGKRKGVRTAPPRGPKKPQ